MKSLDAFNTNSNKVKWFPSNMRLATAGQKAKCEHFQFIPTIVYVDEIL